MTCYISLFPTTNLPPRRHQYRASPPDRRVPVQPSPSKQNVGWGAPWSAGRWVCQRPIPEAKQREPLSKGRKLDVALRLLSFPMFLVSCSNSGATSTKPGELVCHHGFVIVLFLTLVHGSIMFALHTPQPAFIICGWACGPGALTGPHARERERERVGVTGRLHPEEQGASNDGYRRGRPPAQRGN